MSWPTRAERAGGRARQLCVALFDAAADAHDAEVRQVPLVAELVDEYRVLDAETPTLPGAERLVASGADGTPVVAEFLVVELAALLGTSVPSAGLMIADAVNLRDRHPLLWEAVVRRRVKVWQARRIVRDVASAGLDRAAAAWVDDRLAPCLGRLPWARATRKLAGLIVRADAGLAAERAEASAREKFVRIRHEGGGLSLVLARLDTPAAVRLEASVDELAEALAVHGHEGTADERRAESLGALADPARAAAVLAGTPLPRPRAPRAELVVHLSAADLGAPGSLVARSDTLGPLLEGQVRQLLSGCRVTVHPVLDGHADPQVDSYEIPAGIRRAVTFRNPFEVFPFSSRSSRNLPLDHTLPYRHGPGRPRGQTRASNLGPLSVLVHRAKTHGGWSVAQPEPGAFHWTSRLGFTYRVDRGGTTRLPHAHDDGPRAGPGRVDLMWSSHVAGCRVELQ